jgi:hypothetical protein
VTSAAINKVMRAAASGLAATLTSNDQALGCQDMETTR